MFAMARRFDISSLCHADFEILQCMTIKKLSTVSEHDNAMTLFFEDGSEEEVHALIGGDRIHSNVRKHVLRDVPGSWDSFFCKQYSYITLVPIKKGTISSGREVFEGLMSILLARKRKVSDPRPLQ